jgi:anti-sigma B factor antagonist
MNIHMVRKNGWIVFHLEGDLDAGSAAEIQGRFLKSLEEGENSFLLNLEKVDYLDSSGLAALVKFYKEIRARGGTMALCAVQREAMKIFQLTRLDKIFTIYPDAESAQAA